MSPDAARGEERFSPARLRALSWRGRAVLLCCVLVNVYGGWYCYRGLWDKDARGTDDRIWLEDAPRRDSLVKIFDPMLRTGNEALDSSYLPVQGLVYHWSVNLMGQRLLPARRVAIWLHIANSLLLLLLSFRFARSVEAAQLASLLFLFHPRNAATTAWLCASIAHGLVLFLYLGAFLLLQSFQHERTPWRLVAGVLLFAAAVLTKELAATLFAAVLLYDALVVTGAGELWPVRSRVWRGLVARHGAALAVVVAAIVIQRLKYDHGFISSSFGGVEIGIRSLLRLYELLTLVLHWEGRWTAEQVLWAMGALAAATMAGVYLARRDPPLLFLVLWVPLVMTPFTISNFRPAHQLGRYVYEATAVIAVLLAALGARAIRWRPVLTWPLLSGAVLLLFLFASRALEIVALR